MVFKGVIARRIYFIALNKKLVDRWWNDLRFEVDTLGARIRPTMCHDLKNMVFKYVFARRIYFITQKPKLGQTILMNDLKFDVALLHG